MNVIDQAKEVLATESEGILAVRDKLGDEFVQAITFISACSGRLVVTGIGKSGLIGQKIAATLNSTGTSSLFLHPVEAMHGDLGMVSPDDMVLAISYSGETLELKRMLLALKDRCAGVVAMTGDVDSSLSRLSQITLNVGIKEEACPLGLAPTTSTTATLALGDALAVALLKVKKFKKEDFRKNHPGGSLGERLKVAVSEVMLTGDNLPVVSADALLSEAIAELNKKNIGAVVALNKKGQLCGIITDGDLRRLILAGKVTGTEIVQDVMTPQPVTILKSSMAADALSIMQGREIMVLAVVDEEGALSGVLHLHDLLGKGEFRFLI